MSGLVFGAFEAVGYSVLYQNLAPFGGQSQVVTATVWRLLTDSLLHGCMAGIAAYFIGLAFLHRTYRVPLIAIGIGFAAIPHGVYDAYASEWGGVLTAAFIVFVFLGYVHSGDRIATRLFHQGDAPEPLSATSGVSR